MTDRRRRARPSRCAAAPTSDAAVRAGYAWARPDGVVLLSPAAPSFGVFRDYQERAAVFTPAMKACAAG